MTFSQGMPCHHVVKWELLETQACLIDLNEICCSSCSTIFAKRLDLKFHQYTQIAFQVKDIVKLLIICLVTEILQWKSAQIFS